MKIIFISFTHVDEVRKANLHAYRRITITVGPPFMKEVYIFLSVLQYMYTFKSDVLQMHISMFLRKCLANVEFVSESSMTTCRLTCTLACMQCSLWRKSASNTVINCERYLAIACYV